MTQSNELNHVFFFSLYACTPSAVHTCIRAPAFIAVVHSRASLFSSSFLLKSAIQFSGLIVLKIQRRHNTSLWLQTMQSCLSVCLVYIRNRSGEWPRLSASKSSPPTMAEAALLWYVNQADRQCLSPREREMDRAPPHPLLPVPLSVDPYGPKARDF